MSPMYLGTIHVIHQAWGHPNSPTPASKDIPGFAESTSSLGAICFGPQHSQEAPGPHPQSCLLRVPRSPQCRHSEFLNHTLLISLLRLKPFNAELPTALKMMINILNKVPCSALESSRL